MDSIYSTKIVAFIDILEFKDIIKKCKNESQKKLLFSIMEYIKDIKDHNYKGTLRQDEIGKEITVFSDSIVISYDLNENLQGQVFCILMDIIQLQLDLAGQGIILRGAVTMGEIYHKNEIVFGPAMVSAYELESKIAKYPRIIVDNQLLEYASMNPSSQNGSAMELSYILELLSEDKDKWLYIDFLSQNQELDDPNDINRIFYILKKKITEGIQNEDPKIVEKYEWLRNYYNSICSYKI